MARFVEVTPLDAEGFQEVWVNPDLVSVVAVVRSVTTLTLANGDVLGVQDDADELTDRLRGINGA